MQFYIRGGGGGWGGLLLTFYESKVGTIVYNKMLHKKTRHKKCRASNLLFYENLTVYSKCPPRPLDLSLFGLKAWEF